MFKFAHQQSSNSASDSTNSVDINNILHLRTGRITLAGLILVVLFVLLLGALTTILALNDVSGTSSALPNDDSHRAGTVKQPLGGDKAGPNETVWREMNDERTEEGFDSDYIPDPEKRIKSTPPVQPTDGLRGKPNMSSDEDSERKIDVKPENKNTDKHIPRKKVHKKVGHDSGASTSTMSGTLTMNVSGYTPLMTSKQTDIATHYVTKKRTKRTTKVSARGSSVVTHETQATRKPTSVAVEPSDTSISRSVKTMAGATNEEKARITTGANALSNGTAESRRVPTGSGLSSKRTTGDPTQSTVENSVQSTQKKAFRVSVSEAPTRPNTVTVARGSKQATWSEANTEAKTLSKSTEEAVMEITDATTSDHAKANGRLKPTQKHDEHGNETVCSTPDCLYIRWLINSSVDVSQDPCKNFHMYVCSGFNDKLSKTFDLVNGSVSNMITYNLSSDIYRQLAAEVPRVKGQSAFEKAASLLKHCLSSTLSDNTRAIRDFLQHNGMTLVDSLEFDPLEKLVEFSVHIDIPVLFQLTADFAPDTKEFTFFLMPCPQMMTLKINSLLSRITRMKFVEDILALTFAGHPINESIVAAVIEAEDKIIEITSKEYPRHSYVIPMSDLGFVDGDKDLSVRWHSALLLHTKGRLPGQRTLQVTAADLYIFCDIFLRSKVIGLRNTRIFIAWGTALYLNIISGHLEKKEALKYTCFSTVLKVFPIAATYPVLFKHISNSRIAMVKKMTESITQALEESFMMSTWLDDQTQMAARKKLSMLRKYIGYLFNLTSLTAVDILLKDVPDLTGPYTGDLIKVKVAHTKLLWENVFEGSVEYATQGTLNGMTPVYSANAWYLAQTNTIVIPATIMFSPMFSHGAPPEVNYGALGRIITHEMMHGYDEFGRNFDGSGRRSTWFTNGSARAYEKLVGCHNISVNKATKTTRFEAFFNEYLADTMGERSLLKAYRMASRRSSVTIGRVKDLTKDQLFYVSWCLLWCGKNFPSESHPPPEDRCNFPLMNSVHFSETFSCPAYSPMNPKKCPFW
ncbi:neprilysin-1-like [Ornithodoros turicata]|uniref:neprilysin-1-like n=1 Tax=Ornithodoros turicata TaxID=34597 RepID=UPI003138856C